MASKKETTLRGAKLVKKALATAAERGLITDPEPISSSLARKMQLPNGEPLSPALKEMFVTDASWLGIEFDDEEAEIEGGSLEDVVEEAFGEDAVPAFGEAYELFGDDIVTFGAELSRPACLYVGTADESGEYPVLQLSYEDGVARIGGFIPFDVWLAQELGALEKGRDLGDVPQEYAALIEPLAKANGDGRIVFTPKAGEAAAPDENDDEDEGDDASDDDE
jgi:hypothetical protein